MADDVKKNCIVRNLTAEEMTRLREVLESQSWDISNAEYCFFKASKEKTSVAAYKSGKLVVQGKGANDFIEFVLEGAVTGVPEQEPEIPFFPHCGIDESGKGDFFGPLCVGCVFVKDEDTAKKLADIGVRDSKMIKSDQKIVEIARSLCGIVNGQYGIVTIGPEAYNRLYSSFGNLNKLLAWAHIRTLGNLMQKAPECNYAIADQFANSRVLEQALRKAGHVIQLQQMTKGERDIAVAAASILARAAFVRGVEKLSTDFGYEFPKGAGPGVPELAGKIYAAGGREQLAKVAKMHFRTAYIACGETPPDKPDPSVFHHDTSI